jgi:hypothetical protein
MALEVQPPDGRKRVKVYELKDNDWFDRGTGFCTGQILGVSRRAFPCARAVVSSRAHRIIQPPHQHITNRIRLGGTSHICRIGRPAPSRIATNKDHQGRWLSKTARYLIPTLADVSLWLTGSRNQKL